MSDPQTIEVASPELAEDRLSFFRWGSVAGRILITNDAGDWAFLGGDELNELLAGRIDDGHPLFADLQRKGFLRDGLDLDALAHRMVARSRHVTRGPHLHVVTVARAAGSETMTAEAIDQVIDLALQSAATSMAFELRADGGEPLASFETVRRFVETARARNQQSAGKTLTFSVISNLSAMTEEIAEWLIANDVRLMTSLDGPAALHDGNRETFGGSTHADVVRWIGYFHRRYAELARDPQLWHVDALLTTTRATLGAARQVADEYVAHGLRTIRLHPLSPADVDPGNWARIGYDAEQYLAFYREVLGYLLELNRNGTEITERTAAVLASKILGGHDPGVVDLQSPNGAGSGMLAYDVDGRVFPSEEARALAAGGDPLFLLGNAGELTVSDVLRHPNTRAIAAASLLDAQPQCCDCWNKPFCGISPVFNYRSGGELFGQRPHSLEHKERLGISTMLFELLAEGEGPAADLLSRWAATVPAGTSDRLARRVG